MIAALIAWWDARVAKRRAEKRAQGRWYASQVLAANGSAGAEHLEREVEQANWFGAYSDFDAGIEEVLREHQKGAAT